MVGKERADTDSPGTLTPAPHRAQHSSGPTLQEGGWDRLRLLQLSPVTCF